MVNGSVRKVSKRRLPPQAGQTSTSSPNQRGISCAQRPVDFARRARLLEEVDPHLDGGALAEVLARWLGDWHDGRIKLFVTVVALQLRQRLRNV